MFHKENSTVMAVMAAGAGGGPSSSAAGGKNNNNNNNKGKGGGGGKKKSTAAQQQQPETKKKLYKDVPLKKSDRRRLRERVGTVLFGSSSVVGDESTAAAKTAAKGNPQTSSPSSPPDASPVASSLEAVNALLDAIFLGGMLVSRSVDLPPSPGTGGGGPSLEYRKALLYYRSPQEEKSSPSPAAANASTTSASTTTNNDKGEESTSNGPPPVLSTWPYTSTQCVWMQVSGSDRNGRRYDWDAPALALLSVLPPALSDTSSNVDDLRGNLIPRVVLKSPSVSRYLCRGAHLMRAGMMVIPDAPGDQREQQQHSVVTVHVGGNPQPIAVGLYHHSQQQQEGRGVTIWQCYGDDFWRQQQQSQSRSQQSSGDRVISPYGGAPYDDGNYGNVGFVDGMYVVPIVESANGITEEEESEEEETEEEAQSSPSREADGEEGQSAGGSDKEKDSERAGADATDAESSEANISASVSDSADGDSPSPDQVFHDAVCRALSRLHPKKQYLPMTAATFYAKHVLQQPGDIPPIKSTRYKKLQAYLSEQVEAGLLKVGPDNAASANNSKVKGKNQPKKDPMALLLDYNRQHPDILPYLQESTTADGSSTAATSTTENGDTRLAMVDLYCIPHHVATLLRLDADAVRAGNATSPERQGTGMLTLPETRSLLDAYVSGNELVDPHQPSQVNLDGPLTDVLYTKSKKAKKNASSLSDEPRPPASLSRQDLFLAWKKRMEPAYALVQVPGNHVIKLGRGTPPAVTVEVSMRQSRKFLTRVSGLSQFAISSQELAQLVSIRFACAAAVEGDTPGSSSSSAAAKADKSVVVVQGNFAEEMQALLLGDESLTTHGAAKGSPYRLPKKAVQVVLRKGVPGRKKMG